MEMLPSGILNVRHFIAEVQRLLLNSTHGLRNVVNNKGVIVGNEIQFPLLDIDGEAEPVNDGAPTVPEDLFAQTSLATIVMYEAAVKLNRSVLNSTNTAPSLRAMAAAAVVHRMENRFTRIILDVLAQYDDTDMEVGDNSTAFSIDLMHRVGLVARRNNWGDEGRYMLLPAEAEYTLKQDPKFYEIWSIYNAARVEAAMRAKPTDYDDTIRWIPYNGFNVAFMNLRNSKNRVGLPLAADGSMMGYAFKGNRVGFGMNQGMETEIFRDSKSQGSPLVFKTIGAAGAQIIDMRGVIGIKLDPNV
jgi:hypothetical protein